MSIRVYANGQTEAVERFQASLHAQLEAMGLVGDTLPILQDDPTDWPERSLLLYFGSPHKKTPVTDVILEGHRRAGRLIIPVLERPEDAPTCLPEPFLRYNAFLCNRFGDDWPEALVDEVIAALHLQRRSRRIFISYRRVESETVAAQLFDRFVELGFEVFLDTHSLTTGIDFQQGLRWWLNDADLVLVLLTPGLQDSRWVMEEITTAQRCAIGIMGVVWPDEVFERSDTGAGRADADLRLTLGSDRAYQLAPSMLRGAHSAMGKQSLTDEAVGAIVARALRRRAQAVVRRLEALLPLALARYPLSSVQSGTSLGDFVVPGDRGERNWIQVLPFRPTVETFYSLHRSVRASGLPVAEALCFYQEQSLTGGLVEEGLEALRWLLDQARPAEPPSRYRLEAFTG